MEMEASYNLYLVAVSFLVATLASFTAIDLTGRVSAAEGAARRVWLLGGSLAMGLGIWSMHFVGMLSFHLPVPIHYSVPLWLLSIAIAIVASTIAFAVVSRPGVTVRGLLAAAPWMGCAIAGMHYTGMAAMRIAGRMEYDPVLVAVSVAIAIVSSFAALWLALRFGGASGLRGLLGKVASAAIMGLAICGMHYTGMAAARAVAGSTVLVDSGVTLIASRGLAASVILGTLLILGLALAGAAIDRRVRRRIVEEGRLREEMVIRRNEARFRSLVQRSSDVILILEADSTIRFASPAMERVFGHAPEAVVGRRLVELLHPEDASAAVAYLAQAAACTGDMPPVVWRLRLDDGSWRHVDSVGANLGEDDTGGSIVLNARDITDRIALEAQLIHQAFHDALTGLANRALFRDRVEHALARTERAHAGLAVLFLDLDEFKTVNDSLGHASGDLLLSSVAARLLNATRGCDTVARLGGDEFAVLLENVHAHDEATVVAERVIATFQKPFVLEGKEVRVSASVGVARTLDCEGAEELLRNADLAMYRAKHRGKGGFEVFEPEMHAEVRDRLELESDLRCAVERGASCGGEFRLMYQPIVDLETERVIGVEALARWDHPRRGAISPAVFIPMAERTGLIVPLGRWILGEACREVMTWAVAGEGATGSAPGQAGLPAVTVNLSGVQLQQPELVEWVAEALAVSGLAPERLVLEITETAIMHDTEQTLASLRALKGLGVRLAVDDFGTGYSSLSYLQKFPVDILKIDKAFVDGVAAGGQATALTRTIIALGDMLSLRLVAEGIEGMDQCQHLRALGCGYGQGFLFARPLSAADAARLMRSGVAPRAEKALLAPGAAMA